MELAIIVVIIALSFIYFRKFNSIIYAVCTIDIFLRVITKLETMLNISEFSYYVNKYIPGSIGTLIDKYTSSTVNIILMWIYVGMYVVFLVFIVKGLFKKGRR